ncbi:MAG: hypothetical protein R6V12_06870, partial [Candidatus Hydrogenedentota bacterium]
MMGIAATRLNARIIAAAMGCSTGIPGSVEEARSMNGRRVWYRRLGGMPPGRHFTADMDLGWDGRDE